MQGTDDTIQLYTHVKREEWGYAILTHEGRTQRSYQFQDGRLRTFKEGFFQLLQEVEDPPEEARRILSDLQRKHGVAQARQELMEQARSNGQSIMTFRDQVAVFRLLFPAGFQDARWADKLRGTPESDKKRHRQQAVDFAQETLGEDALAALLADGKFDEVVERTQRTLARTDLAGTARDLEVYGAIAPERHEAFARAVFDFLYADRDVVERVDRFVEVLESLGDAPPSWPAVTVLLALVDPLHHICIRPTAFRQQARWFLPSLDLTRKPDGKTYAKVRTMVRDLVKALDREGLVPVDWIDVHDFVRLTLSPKAKQRLAESRASAS